MPWKEMSYYQEYLWSRMTNRDKLETEPEDIEEYLEKQKRKEKEEDLNDGIR